MIAVVLISASQTIAEPSDNGRDHQDNHTAGETDSRGSKIAPAPLPRLPIWTLGQLPPQTIEIITKHEAKEGAQRPKGAGWGETIFFYWDRLWAYITPEQMTAIFTVILGISTIGLWCATRRLTLLAREQARDAKRSLIAANTSANAAMKSAIVAENALYGTEAPFIFAAIEATILADPNSYAVVQGQEILKEFRYSLFNCGRSPAIVREIYITCVPSRGVPGPCPFPHLNPQSTKRR